MKSNDLIWRHVIISVHRSWLPGDERGFRNRDHRIHSTGDYQNPPPTDEHQDLRTFNEARCPDARPIPAQLRQVIAEAVVGKLKALGIEVLVVAVGALHTHIHAKLPVDLVETKKLIGQIKGVASHAVTTELSGQLWAEGGGFDPIYKQEHHRNTYLYIRDRQGPGAWVWTNCEGHIGFRAEDIRG